MPEGQEPFLDKPLSSLGLSTQDSSLPSAWDFSKKPSGELRVGLKSRKTSRLWLVLRFQIPAGTIKESDPTLKIPKPRDKGKLKLAPSPVLINLHPGSL